MLTGIQIFIIIAAGGSIFYRISKNGKIIFDNFGCIDMFHSSLTQISTSIYLISGNYFKWNNRRKKYYVLNKCWLKLWKKNLKKNGSSTWLGGVHKWCLHVVKQKVILYDKWGGVRQEVVLCVEGCQIEVWASTKTFWFQLTRTMFSLKSILFWANVTKKIQIIIDINIRQFAQIRLC